MTREKFLLQMDEILGLPVGALHGDEKLDELETWDSIALINLILLAETQNNASITPDQVAACSAVADLLRLAGLEDNAPARPLAA